MPKDFFTTESFYTLAGAAGMVLVVCNALQSALAFNPRWLALALAEIFALYGVYSTQSAHVPSDYFIAVLNGCLIYCTAVGGNTLVANQNNGRPKGSVISAEDSSKRTFSSRWF